MTFHPYPKTFQLRGKPLKSKKSLNSGKKMKEWEKVRKDLKAIFYQAGIVECELRYDGCWESNGLGFAHLDKRRFLTPEDLYDVVLCCNKCHNIVEALPRLEMKNRLKAVLQAHKSIIDMSL